MKHNRCANHDWLHISNEVGFVGKGRWQQQIYWCKGCGILKYTDHKTIKFSVRQRNRYKRPYNTSV